MSKTFKFTATVVLLTLVAVALSILTGYQSVFLVGVVFLMPVLWTLWIACVMFHKKEAGVSPLVLLWVLIDVLVLLENRSAFGSFHGVDPKGGSELVWLIEFSPPILPMIPFFLLPEIGKGLLAIGHGASYIFLPAGSVGVLKDWLELSVSSAISSYVFVWLRFNWKNVMERIRSKS